MAWRPVPLSGHPAGCVEEARAVDAPTVVCSCPPMVVCEEVRPALQELALFIQV